MGIQNFLANFKRTILAAAVLILDTFFILYSNYSINIKGFWGFGVLGFYRFMGKRFMGFFGRLWGKVAVGGV